VADRGEAAGPRECELRRLGPVSRELRTRIADDLTVDMEFYE